VTFIMRAVLLDDRHGWIWIVVMADG